MFATRTLTIIVASDNNVPSLLADFLCSRGISLVHPVEGKIGDPGNVAAMRKDTRPRWKDFIRR